ncbi:MAG TPA: hypothetical protein VE870_12485 [Bacteroidales bacterium]|nr:hypothetical protein [Bacteroidales bacterium]
MIRTGLIGKFETSAKYAGLIGQLEGCMAAGVWDSGKNGRSTPLNGNRNKVFYTPETLSNSADAVIFTSRQGQTFDMMRDILKDGRHLLICPDPDLSFKKLELLLKIAEEAGVLLYMARHLYIAPLMEPLREHGSNPQYINIYKCENPGTSVKTNHINQTLYLEIISLLSIIHAPFRKCAFTSVPIHSPEPSLVNIRMEFSNGASASLTLNLFSRENYRTTEVCSSENMVKYDTRKNMTEVSGKHHYGLPGSPLKNEILEDFNLNEDIARFLDLVRRKAYPADHYISGIMTHKIAEEIILKLTPVNNSTG